MYVLTSWKEFCFFSSHPCHHSMRSGYSRHIAANVASLFKKQPSQFPEPGLICKSKGALDQKDITSCFVTPASANGNQFTQRLSLLGLTLLDSSARIPIVFVQCSHPIDRRYRRIVFTFSSCVHDLRNTFGNILKDKYLSKGSPSLAALSQFTFLKCAVPFMYRFDGARSYSNHVISTPKCFPTSRTKSSVPGISLPVLVNNTLQVDGSPSLASTILCNI